MPAASGLIRALEERGMLRGLVAAGKRPPAHIDVTDVVLDSRDATPGSLFAAIPGQHADGHDFVPAAVRGGASAVMVERAMPGIGVPQLLVHEARPALAVAAAWVHDFPSQRLGVVGVTGTDGKTTTTYLVRSMLEAAGLRSGLVGTIEAVVGGRTLGNADRITTPEAPELQAHLAAMLVAGDRFVALESSSHALAQHRVGEVAFDVAVLTNLTHEHLEFHGTYDAYRGAKRRLFEALAVGPSNPEKGWGKTGVVNRDDAAAPEFEAATRASRARLITYGADRACDVHPVRVEEGREGISIGIAAPRWRVDVRLRLAGRFNVHNALAAVAVGEALALEPDTIREGLERVEHVRGRMQRVHAGQPFMVVVDYAHTGDALAKVLDNLAPVAAAGGGGLIAVFGSAGERDRLKRPMMGRVAAERCKLVVVTQEDPRGEDPTAILEEIAAGAEDAGARRGHGLLLIGDRRDAIAAAFEQARAGDIVVLAGKGHEGTIETANGAMPWDEVQAALDALASLGYGSAA